MVPVRVSMMRSLLLVVSELAEEQELRDLFERFGRVTRVFLARDRDTQRAKGFAFISFADRSDAARACEKMDGCKFFFLYDSSSCCLLTFYQSVIAISFYGWNSPRGLHKKLFSSSTFDHMPVRLASFG